MVKRVAICIQVYNEGRFLAETLASVLAQTFGDFDLIVSDNHSTDDSARIVRDFQARDARVLLWQPESFCKSLEHARWLFDSVNALDYEASIFIGGHDILDPRYVELLWNSYQANPDASMVVGHGFEIDVDGSRLREWPAIPQLKGGLLNFRPLVVLMSLYYNLAAFGLWPARARRAVKMRHDCVGVDHLLIAEASLLGDLVVEPTALIHTRRTEGAGQHQTYFKKHISDDMQARNIVANFEKQIEWVRHLNALAFAKMPDTIRQINLASSLGCYFSRYGVAQLSAVDGALEQWLNSESGRVMASQLSQVGAGVERMLATAA